VDGSSAAPIPDTVFAIPTGDAKKPSLFKR